MALAAAVALTGCASEQPAAESTAASYTASRTTDGISMPDVTLTDSHGQPFHLRRDTTDPITLVAVAYTSCPDECPLTVSSIATALRRLPPEIRDDVNLLVVAADPPRDTPAVLRAWLDRFDPEFEGVTGDASTVGRALQGLHIPWVPPSPVPGETEYDVSHGMQIWAFGPDDESLLLWNGMPTPTEIQRDLERVAAELDLA